MASGIIFSSNVGFLTGGMGNFELYAVDVAGRNPRRITNTGRLR